MNIINFFQDYYKSVGSSTIITTVITWIAGTAAFYYQNKKKEQLEKTIEKQKGQINSELTKQQGQINSEIETLKQKLNDKSHISQKKFDLELDIYKKLSYSIVNSYDDSSFLLPTFDQVPQDENEEIKLMKDREDEFVKSFNDFSKVSREYSPFYSVDIMDKTDTLRQQMQNLNNLFISIYFGDPGEQRSARARRLTDADQMHKDINKTYHEVMELIRLRLDEL